MTADEVQGIWLSVSPDVRANIVRSLGVAYSGGDRRTYVVSGPCVLNIRTRGIAGKSVEGPGTYSAMGGEKFSPSSVTEAGVNLTPLSTVMLGKKVNAKSAHMTIDFAIKVLDGFAGHLGEIFETAEEAMLEELRAETARLAAQAQLEAAELAESRAAPDWGCF